MVKSYKYQRYNKSSEYQYIYDDVQQETNHICNYYDIEMSNHHEADFSVENVHQETKPTCNYCEDEISNNHEAVCGVVDNATYHNNRCFRKKFEYVQSIEDCLMEHECAIEMCSKIMKMKKQRNQPNKANQ